MRIDLSAVEASITGRITGVGMKSHGLVEWRGSLLTLDSDNSALVRYETLDSSTKTKAAEPTTLWKVCWMNLCGGQSIVYSRSHQCVHPFWLSCAPPRRPLRVGSSLKVSLLSMAWLTLECLSSHPGRTPGAVMESGGEVTVSHGVR